MIMVGYKFIDTRESTVEVLELLNVLGHGEAILHQVLKFSAKLSDAGQSRGRVYIVEGCLDLRGGGEAEYLSHHMLEKGRVDPTHE